MGLGGLPDQLAGMIVWGKLDRWQSGGEASFHQQPVNATRDIAVIKMTTEGLGLRPHEVTALFPTG